MNPEFEAALKRTDAIVEAVIDLASRPGYRTTAELAELICITKRAQQEVNSARAWVKAELLLSKVSA